VTVSRAFDGKSPVAEPTKRRILEVAARLGYRPNDLARGLAQSRTWTLGLVMNTGLWFYDVPDGIEESAVERGYSLIHTRPRRESAVEWERIETLRRRRVDGLLLLSASDTREHNHLRVLHQEGVPIVTINRYCPDWGFTRIFFDYRHATRAVAQRLLAAGHRRIAFVGGSPDHPQHAVREQIAGYREALRAAGAWASAAELFGGDHSYDGEALANELLYRCPETTAVLGVNDFTAAGLLRGFRRLGRRVPEDVAVIGCDDTQIVHCTDPPLSSIRHRTFEAGQLGCRMLLDRIEDTATLPRTVMLRSWLVTRRSCGLVPGGDEVVHELD
jgi:LacI family transcriptional regulator